MDNNYRVRMPYHIYIVYSDKKGKQQRLFNYNFRKARVQQSFATPYMKNRKILISGQFIHSSDIDALEIFESIKAFRELVLPDGTSPVNADPAYTYDCFCRQNVKGYIKYCTDEFITSPPEEKEEPFKDLMKSAYFLGINTNWSLATCALQLQEVAVTLVAKRKKMILDKANVERLLNKKVKELSFNNKYEAFSKHVKTLFNVDMPILTTHLRKMRAMVLHEGYNPKPEETESIVSFTVGLLKKLKDIV